VAASPLVNAISLTSKRCKRNPSGVLTNRQALPADVATFRVMLIVMSLDDHTSRKTLEASNQPSPKGLSTSRKRSCYHELLAE